MQRLLSMEGWSIGHSFLVLINRASVHAVPPSASLPVWRRLDISLKTT